MVALKANQHYIKEQTPWFIDFMKGVADGCTDAGVKLTYEEVLAYFSSPKVYSGSEPPGSEYEKLPPNDCSGFAAWGSATKDRELIITGSGEIMR